MGHVLAWHLDGRLPNLAVMRLAAHHRALGDTVELRPGPPSRLLWDRPTHVYGSLLFTRSRPLGEQLRVLYPDAPWTDGMGCHDHAGPGGDSGGGTPRLYPLSGVSPQPGLYATGLPPALPLCVVPLERGARPARRHDCRHLARGALATESPPAGQ